MIYCLTKDRFYKRGSLPSLASVLSDEASEDEIVDPVYAKRPIVRTMRLISHDYADKILSQEEVKRRLDAISALDKNRDIYVGLRPRMTYRDAGIPKKSGGIRKLEIPNPLMKALQKSGARALALAAGSEGHGCAYGFMKRRSVVDAMERHRRNRSRWFLKLDIKDFFGSTTRNDAVRQLIRVYPFCLQNEVYLSDLLEPYFYRDCLPQGAPTSPILSNLVMVPFDCLLSRKLNEKGFVYTRYADDMLISHKDKFDWREMIQTVTDIFAGLKLPYKLNHTKTRFGSSSGRNWNLGLMLNKDNELTVGWRTKKTLKAMLYAEITKALNGEPKDPHMQGLVAWYRMTEPDKIMNLIDRYSKKFNVDLRERLNIRK